MMNNRAELGMTIKIGIGLVLGIIILLFSLSIGTNFLGIFFAEPTEQTENSMDNLKILIDGMGDQESDSFLFITSKDYYLVSFNKGKLGKSGQEGYYEKPPTNECYDRACLIICSATDNVDACIGSSIARSFEGIETIEVKEPGNPAAGIVTYKQGDMVSIYVARYNNHLILKEIEEGESVEELTNKYFN